MQYPASMTFAKGLSLIELLIAMVLGLTLATGVMQLYVSNNTADRDQEARLRIQENGRFGLNFLGQEIRMAGYLGCLGAIDGTTVNITLAATPLGFQPQFGVQGWEAAGTDPGQINNSANNVAVVSSNTAEWTTTGVNVIPVVNAVPNSDIIRVWGAEGSPGVVSVINPGATPTMVLDTAIGLAASDFVLVSDCEQADIVQACTVTDNAPATNSTISISNTCVPGNNASALISSVAPAEAIKLQGTLFWVGKRGNVATNPPALFRARLAANGTAGVAEELIEGVESMQILYGENLDGDVRSTVETYVPADQVGNWLNVISVRISLLMQSVEDGSVPSPQPYTFNGVNYDGTGGNGALPADDRVRRVFTSTINLRNRTLGI